MNTRGRILVPQKSRCPARSALFYAGKGSRLMMLSPVRATYIKINYSEIFAGADQAEFAELLAESEVH